MRTAALEAEWDVAQHQLSKSDALELLAADVPKGAIMHMIGISRVTISGSSYEPSADGRWAYISPIRVADTDTPYAGSWCYTLTVLDGDLIDLVCWDVVTPNAWALRAGAAEWAGCVVGNEPTMIRRNPFAWLRARCDGLLLLTRDKNRREQILRDCNLGR